LIQQDKEMRLEIKFNQ